MLSVLSAAHPEIADYPFTTKTPVLGIVKTGDFDSLVMSVVSGFGLGLMGAGIASVSLGRSQVVLKDISREAADKGKAYSEKLLAKRVERGRMTEEKKADILGLIQPTADDADLAGCDLIIEAVFENMAVKCQPSRSVCSTGSQAAPSGLKRRGAIIGS